MRKLLLSLFLLLGVVAPAQGQLLQYCFTVDSQATVGSTTGSIVEPPTEHAKFIAGHLTWANDAGSTPTLDAKIQHCKTESTSTCEDLITFTQATTGSGVETKVQNNTTFAHWPYLRAVSTVGGTSSPTYTYTVQLCYAGAK